MNKVCTSIILISHCVFALPWASYTEFETAATNALSNIDVLLSANFTNQLAQCINELNPTNELASSALLMLAISDDAKSNNLEEFVGNTNSQARVSWFMTSLATERTLWHKACAVTMLSTGNADPVKAVDYFNCATNTLHQWDSMPNCFSGGQLYLSIARHYGAAELSPRMCLVFAAADSAKTAGMVQQFNYYADMLPAETREFLCK